jgi:hypothetical protein
LAARSRCIAFGSSRAPRLASSLHERTVVIVFFNYLAIVGGVSFCAADQLISGA